VLHFHRLEDEHGLAGDELLTRAADDLEDRRSEWGEDLGLGSDPRMISEARLDKRGTDLRRFRAVTGRRIARTVVLVSTVAALAGCGSSSQPGYTASAKASFLKGCEARAAATTCTCILDYLVAHVPASKVLALPAEVKAGKVPSFYAGAISACVSHPTTTT
jgi:hypothetical protein